MKTTEGILKIKTEDVVFRKDLYPRIETNPETVQKYSETIDVLPPIILNQRNELIDGWHRWTAHKKNGIQEIRIDVRETESDAQIIELAIEYNAAHGLQLSQEDKRNMARSIYHVTADKDRDTKKKHLAKILSVPERTIREWLSRIDKDSKTARNKRIVELWMACRTQEEIAERENVTQKAVSEILEKMAELPEGMKPAANHLTDFDPPIYNIWKQQSKTNGSKHFGNSEVKWLDNLLYLYTKPFDVVVDPFAGGGSTIDICKKRSRRYWVSDRKPIVEREHEIRSHDILTGMPQIPRWKDVSLVYLDPPYWKQAEGQYSDDPSDFANMTLADFNKNLSNIICQFSKKLQSGFIALIIQPTQWKSPDREFTDHIGDMLGIVKSKVDMRYSAPYESQQCNPQMVDWAKSNKKCLVLTREIVVWRI